MMDRRTFLKGTIFVLSGVTLTPQLLARSKPCHKWMVFSREATIILRNNMKLVEQINKDFKELE